MQWRFLVAGAFASAFVAMLAAGPASATVRISNDPGGEVIAYLHKYRALRQTGEKVVIDGPCLSACTLLTGVLPKSQVCVTRRAVLGFHAASYYNDISRTLVPTRAGSRLVMRFYPSQIRNWINRNGGLTPRLIRLQGRELAAMYDTCD